MLPASAVVSLFIFGIGTFLGVVTNGFILAVNFMVSYHGTRLHSSDLIIFTLGLSNITFQITMAINDFCAYLWSDVFFSFEAYAVITVLIQFTIFSSFWFTVCLCGFYCVQILIVTRPFLIKLKQNISTMVPWLLLGSILASLTLSLPAAFIGHKEPLLNMTYNITVSIALEAAVPTLDPYYLLFSNILGCTLPLILVAISNTLIVNSLCAHGKNMAQSASTTVPSGEASLKAARIVTSLLIIYILFYTAELMMFLDMFPPSSPWVAIFLSVIYLYLPAQSIILILGSSKLTSMSVKILDHWRCWRKKL